MKSLQSALEDQFADLPRLITTQIVRKKLELQGCGDREDVVATIVERLLLNDASDDIGDRNRDSIHLPPYRVARHLPVNVYCH